MTTENAALKDGLDERRFRTMAQEVVLIYPGFDSRHFLQVALPGLDELSLLQRVRRMTEALYATLPENFSKAVKILRKLAPGMGGFASLVPPDYIAQYGQDDFENAMDALKYFTGFGTSEFAVREFLRNDPLRALSIMEVWSRDDSDAVRRLASEGSRPRLPWSFRLDPILRDPSLAGPILENLRADFSLYVRKSVANHLNDVTKSHPTWVLDTLGRWLTDNPDNPYTVWIAKRALRSLIKAGDGRALAAIGAGDLPEVKIGRFDIQPRRINLGESLALSFDLISTSQKNQRLVIDYKIHYVKKSGATSEKVFKLKELTLNGMEQVSIKRNQSIRNFTTRVHYPGRHEVEILVNGQNLARHFFDLIC